MNDTPTHAQWVERFGAVAGWRGEIVDETDAASPLGVLVSGLDLSVPLILATQRIRFELGYREVVDATTALRHTFDDEVRRGFTAEQPR